MELSAVILAIGALLLGLALVLRRKIRNLRATADFAVGMGQEMWGRGNRLSALISPGPDAVAGIIDARMATVGLAAAVLARDRTLGQSDWHALNAAIMAHYRTGEEQAADMVMLCKWLIGKLRSDADLDRLAGRAAELFPPDQVAQDLAALVRRSLDATGGTAEPGLSRVLADLVPS